MSLNDDPRFSGLDDRYELMRLLGEGGMGAVVLARDRVLGRLVAIKVIKPGLGGDPERRRRRFHREARIVASLSHPNIVPVFDASAPTPGRAFVVTEYVDGESLWDLLGERPMEPIPVAAIVRGVCAALAYAHNQRVVHLDLKPGNVMVGRDGRVRLHDFGVARVLTDDQQSVDKVAGTLLYMSPDPHTYVHAKRPPRDIYGNQRCPLMCSANDQANFVALMVVLARCRGTHVVVEVPENNLLGAFPSMYQALTYGNVLNTQVFSCKLMGAWLLLKASEKNCFVAEQRRHVSL